MNPIEHFLHRRFNRGAGSAPNCISYEIYLRNPLHDTLECQFRVSLCFPHHRQSKHIFQRDLYLAHVRAGRIDPAESSRRYADVGITPVRMVRDVERLEPELECVILDNPKLLMG